MMKTGKEISQEDIDTFYSECDGALSDLFEALGAEYIKGSEDEVRDFVAQRAYDKFHAEYGQEERDRAVDAVMTEWCGGRTVN